MPEITIQEFAKVKGVSRQAVYDAVARGRIHRLPNGKLDEATALKSWTENTNPFRGGQHPRRQEEARKSPKLDSDSVLEIFTYCFWEFQYRMLPHTANLLVEAGLSPQRAGGLLREKVVCDAAIMGAILGIEDKDWINLNCDALQLTRDREALAKQIKAWWKESPLNEPGRTPS